MEETVKKEYKMKLKESERNGTPAPVYEELLANMQSRRKAVKFHYSENKWLPKEQLETYERLKYENYNLLTSVGDTQNPNGIESLKMEGFPINEDYKKPLIISSVNQVKELNIYIHKNCENTIKEIESYVYEKNKNGESEKPVKFNDHAMDALRYNVNNVLTDYRGNVLSDGGVSDWESIMVLGKNGEFL